MRLFLISLLLAFCLSCTSCLTPRNIKDIYSESSNAVYLLSYPDGHCTAFHIGAGYVVTASHCVRDNIPILVVDNENKFILDKPIINEKEADIAVYYVPEVRNFSYLILGDDFSLGQQVVAIGFPGYLGVKIVDTGHLIAKFNMLGTLILVADGNIWPGESGGPLFDEKGFVIGIASRLEVHEHVFETGETIKRISSIFVSTKDLKKYLDPIYRQDIFPSPFMF